MADSSGKADSIDALKALYDGQQAALKLLFERSFSATLQALGLNIAVVAALIGGRVCLSLYGKQIGTALLLIFNVLIILYLASKSRAHHRRKQELLVVEGRLAKIAGVDKELAKEEAKFFRSFAGGSGIFILAVTLGCGCAVGALWLPLLCS